jgi:hypothetical protein
MALKTILKTSSEAGTYWLTIFCRTEQEIYLFGCHFVWSRRLEDGDIVDVDVTVWLDGYHGTLVKLKWKTVQFLTMFPTRKQDVKVKLNASWETLLFSVTEGLLSKDSEETTGISL